MTTTVGPAPNRSAFAAAFLSFIFPGLGQIYAGRLRRGAAFALPAAALAAIALALFLHYGLIGFGLWLGQSSVLGPLVPINAALLVYRLAACLDAYALCLRPLPAAIPQAEALQAETPPAAPTRPAAFGRRLRRHRSRLASAAGLVAIVVVLVADHAIVAYWNVRAYNLTRDVHSPVAIGTDDPGSSEEPIPTVTLPPDATIAPAATTVPWNRADRLNILLVGADNQAGGFRTDSMIVVSLDPATHRVAMFSIPRDTYGLPMPPKSRLSSLWGPNYYYKLNTLWKYSDGHRDLFPGGGVEALKQALGYLYFGDQAAISYYVLVDLIGFMKVVDALGGVTVDVPAPVVDDGFPGVPGSSLHRRIYIQAGIQHMSGEVALAYARSRKASNYFNDYNRSARQQQLLVALQQQANFDDISANLSKLMDALAQSIHTDLPEDPEILRALLEEARHIRSANITTYAFSPPTYGKTPSNLGGYVFVADVPAIRKAVEAALAGEASPDRVQVAVDEQASILVQNGTGETGQDTALASYLASLGFDAQASTAVPTQLGGLTRLISVNGAADQYPATFAQLQAILELPGPPSSDPNALVQAVSDPARPTGFIIVTGIDTPTPSPGSGSPSPGD